MRPNEDVRRYASDNAVLLWQIADGLGIADATLSRRLRKELPQDMKQRIFNIVDKIVRDREEA